MGAKFRKRPEHISGKGKENPMQLWVSASECRPMVGLTVKGRTPSGVEMPVKWDGQAWINERGGVVEVVRWCVLH